MPNRFSRLSPDQQVAMAARWPALEREWGHYQGLVALTFTRTLFALAVGFTCLSLGLLVLAVRSKATDSSTLAALLWIAVLLGVVGVGIYLASLLSRRVLWRFAVPMFRSFAEVLPFDVLYRLRDGDRSPLLTAAVDWSHTWKGERSGYEREAMLDELFSLASEFAPGEHQVTA